MMQSRTAPCQKGDEIRDYKAMGSFPAACDAVLRGWNPSYVNNLHGVNNKNVGSLQAPSGSVIAGEVVVNERGKHEGVPLSAGIIATVCIVGIVILFMCLCFSEILSSLSWLRRRRHSISTFNRQDVHGDRSRAALESNAELSSPNHSEVVSANHGSLTVASSASGLNDPQVGGSKLGLAHWVIKGLPIIKYKKQKRQLHGPRVITTSNSASSVEFSNVQNIYQNSAMMIGGAAVDHDIESALQVLQAIYNDPAPDYNGLECVVCLSPFEEDEAVRVLPQCCHEFHAACIDSWLLLHSTCPLCRVHINSLDVGNDGEPARAGYVMTCNTASL